MMPGMDGVEVAQKLRSGDTTEDIPIIMFTAKSQLEDKITGLEAGADIYLTKPTQPRELFAQVKALLKRSKKARHNCNGDPQCNDQRLQSSGLRRERSP